MFFITQLFETTENKNLSYDERTVNSAKKYTDDSNGPLTKFIANEFLSKMAEKTNQEQKPEKTVSIKND